MIDDTGKRLESQNLATDTPEIALQVDSSWLGVGREVSSPSSPSLATRLAEQTSRLVSDTTYIHTCWSVTVTVVIHLSDKAMTYLPSTK